MSVSKIYIFFFPHYNIYYSTDFEFCQEKNKTIFSEYLEGWHDYCRELNLCQHSKFQYRKKNKKN